jgi:hypothetical protein
MGMGARTGGPHRLQSEFEEVAPDVSVLIFRCRRSVTGRLEEINEDYSPSDGGIMNDSSPVTCQGHGVLSDERRPRSKSANLALSPRRPRRCARLGRVSIRAPPRISLAVRSRARACPYCVHSGILRLNPHFEAYSPAAAHFCAYPIDNKPSGSFLSTVWATHPNQSTRY